MTSPLFDVQSTLDDGGRHRASPWRGLRMGFAALVVSLLPPAWLIGAYYLFGQPRASVSLEGTAALVFLLSMLAAIVSPAVAILLGALALRRSRVLGRVMAVLAILIAIAAIVVMVVGQFSAAGYL